METTSEVFEGLKNWCEELENLKRQKNSLNDSLALVNDEISKLESKLYESKTRLGLSGTLSFDESKLEITGKL